jgi:hypothetical protein
VALTTYKSFWNWILQNFGTTQYDQHSLITDLRGDEMDLPLLICMPHTSCTAWELRLAMPATIETVMQRLAERGVKILPEWEEGSFFLRKASLTLEMQDRFPAPKAGEDLVDVFVLPTVLVPSPCNKEAVTQVSECNATMLAFIHVLTLMAVMYCAGSATSEAAGAKPSPGYQETR